jgi:uncharacterized protein
MFDGPVIDILDFARYEGRLAGTVAARRLARLSDLLEEGGGEVTYEISGRVDADGNPRLLIDVSCRLRLRCQRCLGPVWHAIASSRELRFLSDASLLTQIEDEMPELDDLLMPTGMRTLDWVEDEIMLGLPISPRHEVAECRPPRNPAAEPDDVVKPLAQLAKLGFRNTKNQ